MSKELAQKIHDKAAPFIKWLQEAEEETSESDGSYPFHLFSSWCALILMFSKLRFFIRQFNILLLQKKLGLIAVSF